MSELDKYLGDIEKGGNNSQFDILEWWKVNATKYRVLSLIARDVLARPISTVASESAFSTGGRILDPFRSSLAPKMVEVLVCAQNWLRSNIPISLRQAMNDIEEFEQQYDSGNTFNDLFCFKFHLFCIIQNSLSSLHMFLLCYVLCVVVSESSSCSSPSPKSSFIEV